MIVREHAVLDPRALRRSILRMSRAGNSVHVGCAFSIVEILACLYSKVLAINPSDAADPARDRLILSKGHGVMALYACHHALGWIPDSALDNYFADGSELHGLAEWKTPGFEATAGSLGHGLPVATGIAWGLKQSGRTEKVFCVVGDGEMNEGTMWESLLFAHQHRLENLTVIVDANAFQAMGPVREVIDLEPLVAKFESFGFETEEADGHDLGQLQASLHRLAFEPRRPGQPKALVARTVKGKGVSFMEGNNQWHYLRLDDAILARALEELA